MEDGTVKYQSVNIQHFMGGRLVCDHPENLATIPSLLIDTNFEGPNRTSYSPTDSAWMRNTDIGLHRNIYQKYWNDLAEDEARGEARLLMKALNYFPTAGTNLQIALATFEISKLYQSVLRLRRRSQTQYWTTNPNSYQYRYLYQLRNQYPFMTEPEYYFTRAEARANPAQNLSALVAILISGNCLLLF